MSKDKFVKKPTCFICGKYTDKKTSPQCYGHGGLESGGGDAPGASAGSKSSGSAAASGSNKTADTASSQTAKAVTGKHVAANIHAKSASSEKPFSFQLSGKASKSGLTEKPINFDIISDLLSDRLFFIDNNKEQGTLTFKLLCKLEDLSPEQRDEFKKLIEGILKELEEFKEDNGIFNNCKLLQTDNMLSIGFLPPARYDDFIRRLADKNLLPIQNIEQKTKEVTYQKGMNHFTPFSTKPTPSVKSVEDDSQNKSSIRSKSPLKIKPTRWE